MISWYVSQKLKSGSDFLLGGRKLPLLLTLGTTVATMVGTGSSMGAVGFAYQHGLTATLYGVGGSIGIFLLAWIFSPMRQYQFITMSEEIAYYVGAHPYVKNTIAIIIFIASIGWLGAHIIGGGMYLSWLTNIDLFTAKIIIAFSFAVFVIIGGYSAVVWTDSIQAIVLFAGFILMAVVSIKEIGGIESLIPAQPQELFSNIANGFNLVPALSLSVAILVGILATPSFRQRIYSGKDVKSVRQSFIYSGILYLAFSIIPAIIGMAAFKLAPDLKNPSFAFPHLALHLMPAGLAAIVIVAGISATLSSASSDAIAAVSVVLRDLYSLALGKMPSAKRVVFLSRISLVAISSFALLLATLSNDIVGYITGMISILLSGLCVCALLGRFWSRYNWQGAIASLVSGSLTALIINYHPHWSQFWGNPVIPSLIGSLLAGILIALITPPNQVSAREALVILSKQRAQMENQS